MRRSWWKILCTVLLLYTLVGGLLLDVPRKKILNETIRNIYFHVPLWFGMMILFTCSVIYAVKYLRKPDLTNDIYATAFAATGTLFGVLGLITGAIWAKYTWGKPWSNDIKQLGAAMALLIYAAFFVLRNSITDIDKRARVAAVYNIFAFAMLFPALWIVPREAPATREPIREIWMPGCVLFSGLAAYRGSLCLAYGSPPLSSGSE